ELEYVRAGFVDPETREILDRAALARLERDFPVPWPHFRRELQARLYEDDPAKLRTTLEALGTYPPQALAAVRPLFVSRAAARRGTGELHAATIKSVRGTGNSAAIEKVPLENLTLEKLERMVGRHDPRNAATYELLKRRLEEANGDGKKAFGNGQSVRKPSRDPGRAPLIRSIKIEVTQNSGVFVRGGIADLGNMLRVDVFRTANEFSVVPRYGVPSSRTRTQHVIPSDAKFCLSLTKNDFVEIDFGTTKVRGYFVMYESDGRVTLRAHDQPQPDKKFFRRSIAKAVKLVKFHVDILGNLYPAELAVRRGLA
ncbi:MAG: hypothetical protein NZ533_12140, partial [Casimicrobiaceae bacterium]|nr:hypothetical protein [Casimicrobiaceae bacterium]